MKKEEVNSSQMKNVISIRLPSLFSNKQILDFLEFINTYYTYALLPFSKLKNKTFWLVLRRKILENSSFYLRMTIVKKLDTLETRNHC